jgi:hypothetical protein
MQRGKAVSWRLFNFAPLRERKIANCDTEVE